MDSDQVIQKVINGKTYIYNRKNDTISLDNGNSYTPKTEGVEVEICHEVTINCNHFCENCFSNSGGKGSSSKFLDFSIIKNNIMKYEKNVIRNCISGGEPFTHPHIEKILDLPILFQNCGFVIVTNGTLGNNLDAKLIENRWCTIVSLHGMERAHNFYTKSNSFKTVTNRIAKLASKGCVHIHTVIHNHIQIDDIIWLLKFRDDTGVNNIKFLKPRPFGRYVPLENNLVSNFVDTIHDDKVKIMSKASNIPFIDVNGIIRRSN